MDNTFLQVQGDKIIIDKAQLTMYAAAAAAVIVIVLIALIANKARQKNFIKTIPTNLKDVR